MLDVSYVQITLEAEFAFFGVYFQCTYVVVVHLKICYLLHICLIWKENFSFNVLSCMQCKQSWWLQSDLAIDWDLYLYFVGFLNPYITI